MASSAEPMQALRVRWWGVVQGVGFRASARRAALAHGCVGWVRNLGDGSVDAHLQGEAAAIDATLTAIARLHGRRIASVNATPATVEAGRLSFTILGSARSAEVLPESAVKPEAPT